MRAVWVTVVLASVCAAMSAAPQQPRAAHGRLFPPEKLGELEGPDRDEWQQPEQIMDRLLIADGSRVGDIGAGGGWFTVRLARRVGPNGRVFAEDIQRQMIESMQRRVAREGLNNVETIQGSASDPRLPSGLDAVLIVDTYPQLDDPIGLLTHVRRSLAPGGRLGIVEFKTDVLGPGPDLEERLDPSVIIRDAERAGLKLQAHEVFLRYQYLLVFTPR